MKPSPIISTILLLSAVPLFAQSATTRDSSPRAILDQFLTMGINGDLLTREGWNKAGLLFVHPSPQPHDKPITVIGDDYSLHEISARGNQAELFVTYRDLGRIDSSLRYSPPDARFPKLVVRYHLMLIAKPTPAGKGASEATGAREWRIQNRQDSLWIGLNAAIVYVTEKSSIATNPSIKRNADATLAVLKKLK